MRDDMVDLQKARQNVQMFLDEPIHARQVMQNKNHYHSL